MKTIKIIAVAIIALLGAMCVANAQNYGMKWSEPDKPDYWYISPSFDVNKAFGIIDNPRTEKDHRGLDFDLEAGVRDSHVGVYIFYGQFTAMNYKNYGAGVDYYVMPFTNVHLSLGAYYSTIIRQRNESATSYISPRAVTTIWLSKNIGVLAKLQYQGRPDLGKSIIEGAAGLTIKFDN